MFKLIAVAIGGSAGALLRYAVTTQITHLFGRDFPYGTLVVNVTGSFILGLFYTLFHSKWNLSQEWLYLVQFGLLGAFTTFSTFSMDAIVLLQQSQFIKAGVYIGGSVLLSLIGLYLGIVLARAIAA